MHLTAKQSRYLELIQHAKSRHVSLRVVAEEAKVNPANLYAAAKQLRKKGVLQNADAPTSTANDFVRIPLGEQSGQIELKTQLANGQLVWMGVPTSQLASVLQVLSQ